MAFAEGRSSTGEGAQPARTKATGKIVPFRKRDAADIKHPTQPLPERIGKLEMAILLLSGALALGFIAIAIFIAMEVG